MTTKGNYEKSIDCRYQNPFCEEIVKVNSEIKNIKDQSRKGNRFRNRRHDQICVLSIVHSSEFLSVINIIAFGTLACVL